MVQVEGAQGIGLHEWVGGASTIEGPAFQEEEEREWDKMIVSMRTKDYIVVLGDRFNSDRTYTGCGTVMFILPRGGRKLLVSNYGYDGDGDGEGDGGNEATFQIRMDNGVMRHGTGASSYKATVCF